MRAAEMRGGGRGGGATKSLLSAVVTATAVLTALRVVSAERETSKHKSFKRADGRDRPPPQRTEEKEEIDLSRECPYLVESEGEALARGRDPAIAGNVLTVEHLRFCRTGNHFSSVYRNLALGYCCKSKLVELPPKDEILAPGIFNKGTPGPRWFDFTGAPDVEGFDSSICDSDITWAGQRAFRMSSLETPGHQHHTPKLRECIAKAPRLVACEAAYYFPQSFDVCGVPTEDVESFESAGESTMDTEGMGEREGNGVVSLRANMASEEEEEAGARAGARAEDGWGGGAGNLVLHIRSGDIFDDEILSYYGQPPLEFYMQVMQDQPWDRVDVVTSASHEEALNPVVTALMAKADLGELQGVVHIHTNRTMEQDLHTMMCADGITLARSTLVALTGFHTTAAFIYGPTECSTQLRQLGALRSQAKVFGIKWPWPREYSVYKSWENTSEQREEMVAYKHLSLKQCI